MPTTLSRKLSILFLGSYYAPYTIGGAEKMLQIHAEGFAANGHRVAVATLGPGNRIVREQAAGGIRLFRCPVRNLYWPLDDKPGTAGRVLWHLFDSYNPCHDHDLQTVVEETHPDVVVCEALTGWSAAVWKFFSRRHIPIVQIAHDSSYLCATGTMFRHGTNCAKPCLRCRLLTLAYRACNHLVAHYVFVSNAQLQRFEQAGFTRRPCSVVYNAEPISVESKADLWQGQRSMQIGFIATLSEGKGVINLIRAFKMLQGDFRLTIGGKAVSEMIYQHILQEAGDDPRIRIVGYVDTEQFFRHTDLAVVPSIVHESFGLVAVEACAKGVPVIAADRGGLTEIIAHGANGLHCRPEDPAAIAAAIQSLYDNLDLYSRLAGATHQRIQRFTDTGAMVAELEQICYSTLTHQP